MTNENQGHSQEDRDASATCFVICVIGLVACIVIGLAFKVLGW